MSEGDDGLLHRVYHTLADGRRVYYSTSDGRVAFLDRNRVEQAYAFHVAGFHGIAYDDPLVYAADLSEYQRRSWFLADLRPFVMVVDVGHESARTPIDRAAFVAGGRRACEVGMWAPTRGDAG